MPKTNDKPARPETAHFFPPADCTRAAFIQNALALEKFGGRTQYLNMPEVEMGDGLCGGHKQVSHMLRNIYDVKRAGALRATDRDEPGERLFLQLQKVLPSLVHHHLPPGCKDFSDYYLKSDGKTFDNSS